MQLLEGGTYVNTIVCTWDQVHALGGRYCPIVTLFYQESCLPALDFVTVNSLSAKHNVAQETETIFSHYLPELKCYLSIPLQHITKN